MNIRKTSRSPSNFKSQQGWTMWSMMFVAGVLVLFSYVGMQLVPVYSTNGNIKNAMQQALNRANDGKVTRASIIRSMHAQLYVDGSHKFLDYKNDLKVKRSKKALILEVSYKREVPLFFNLSLLASFDNVAQKDHSAK